MRHDLRRRGRPDGQGREYLGTPGYTASTSPAYREVVIVEATVTSVSASSNPVLVARR